MPPPFAPQAPHATLHGGQLVCLASAAPGGARWDVARCIDLLQARESVSFLTKMRPEVASAARDLEAWVARQQHGLGLAAHADSLQQSAETLLKASVLLGGNYCSRLTKLGLCAATAAAEQHHLLRCLASRLIYHHVLWLLPPLPALIQAVLMSGCCCLHCSPAPAGHGQPVPDQEQAAGDRPAV